MAGPERGGDGHAERWRAGVGKRMNGQKRPACVNWG